MAKTKHTVSVTFRDYKGKCATVIVRKGTTLNDAKELAKALKPWSRAAVIGYSHTEAIAYDSDVTGSQQLLTTEAGEHYDRVEQKAVFLFTDGDNGDRIRLSLPAPNDNAFDADQEPTPACAEAIAEAIAKATTRESANLIYNGGGVIGKLAKIRKTERKKNAITGG